jgi:formiminotetrahydrofolate cyclodeaminase
MKKTGMLRVTEYVDAVAAKEPVPGGGSVNGVFGSTAAALMLMVIAYSENNKNCAEHKSELESARKFFVPMKDRFLSLSDADIKSFGAYALGDKGKAAVAMTGVPFDMAELAYAAVSVIRSLKGKTNKFLEVDRAIAEKTFVMIFETSCMNVHGNIAQIADEKVKERFEINIEALARSYRSL